MTRSRFIAPLLALALAAPVTAEAQFTTFVAPPNRVDTVVVVDTQAVVADSVSRASIENMKAWVDSAAGGAIDLSDTTAVPVTATATGDVFADGSPAPDTATPLPMLLTLGFGVIGAGALLLRRR